jgi:hypothetical protein
VSACCLWYPACNARAPYCHLWPARLYNIFSTLSHKPHDLRDRVAEHKMCVLILFTTSYKNFLILEGTERDKIQNVHWSSCKVLVIVVRF